MKQDSRLSLRRIQVRGRQSAAYNHVVITPVEHPANMLLAWLILASPSQTQANQEEH
jgi:hypothetical protein